MWWKGVRNRTDGGGGGKSRDKYTVEEASEGLVGVRDSVQVQNRKGSERLT